MNEPEKFLVSAFQINDAAIATIKSGDELLCSGIYESHFQGEYCDIVIGDRKVHCRVTSTNDDPKLVGWIEGQKRFRWNGEVITIRANRSKGKQGARGKKP
jgi:hypothetical protein